MICLDSVMAIQGHGLQGDRYATGSGSYNQQAIGKRQVTLMHVLAFAGQDVYSFPSTRRNLLIGGDAIELAWLLSKGHAFDVGAARLQPVAYCDPCHVPTRYIGETRERSFRTMFWERGGIIANVIRSGLIALGSPVIALDKGYGTSWDE